MIDGGRKRNRLDYYVMDGVSDTVKLVYGSKTGILPGQTIRLPEEILPSTSRHAARASESRRGTVAATDTTPRGTDSPATRSFSRVKPAILICTG